MARLFFSVLTKAAFLLCCSADGNYSTLPNLTFAGSFALLAGTSLTNEVSIGRYWVMRKKV